MAKTTVPGAYIADNAVVSAKIASNAIEASHISGGAVVSVDIGDNSITISKIAANAVSTSEIAANAIGSSEIAANAVDSAEIVSGSIDTAHIADSQVTNAKLANSSVTVNSNSLSLGASLTLDTDDIGEGSSNLYHTTARVNSAFDTRLGTKDTGDLSEGSNLYHTTERVQDVTGAQLVTNGSHTGISFSYDDANDGAIDATVSLSGFNTDALSEGSSNLYFTNARAQGALTAGTGIGISSGEISIGQSVATNASPTFDSLTLTGALNITGDINAYNVTDLDVVDKTITLGVGQTEANSGGSGIIIDGSSASLLWDETNDTWDFNKTLHLTTATTNYALIIEENSGGEQYQIGVDSYGGLVFYNSTTKVIEFTDSSEMQLYDGGSVTTKISPSSNSYFTGGDVGIGTQNPTHKLHVQGTSNDTIDETKGTMKVQASGGNGMILGTIASSPYTSYIQSAYVQDTSVAQYNLALNPIGGNVGIGTNSPNKKLHVRAASSGGSDYGVPGLAIENDTNVSLQFMGGASHQLGITFSDPGTTEAGYIYYNTGTNDLKIKVEDDVVFNSGTTETVRIDSSGNFGILTGNQGTQYQRLHVGGSGASIYLGNNSADTNFIHTGGCLALTADTDVYITCDSNDVSSATPPSGVIIFGGGSSTDTDGNLDFTEAEFGNNGAARVEYGRFHSNGFFGLNTTPGVELDLKRKTNAYPFRIGSETGEGRAMVFADVASTPTKYNWLVGSQYNIDNAFEITPSTAVGGYTFSTPGILVKQDGKVGIGETVPLAKLHVKEGDSGQGTINSNFDQLCLEDDQHAGMSIFSGSSSDGAIYFGDSGSNDIGQIKYKHNGDVMAFTTAGAEQLTLYQTQNGGITEGYLKLASIDSATFIINADTDNSEEDGVPTLDFKMDGSVTRFKMGVAADNNPYISTQSDIALPLIIKTGTSGQNRVYINDTGMSISDGTAAAPDHLFQLVHDGAPVDDRTFISIVNGTGVAGTDISTPESHIDFEFFDANSNQYPQARISVGTGNYPGQDANTQILEGEGYISLRTNDATSSNATEVDPAPALIARGDGSVQVSFDGTNDRAGYFYAGKDWGATNHRINRNVTQGANVLVVSGYGGSGIGADTALFMACASGGRNSAATGLAIEKNSSTGRSINAAGTINASGNDYAEYVKKSDTCGAIAKGDICGIDENSEVTDKWSEAHSFVVKSTDPSYVGGDTWGTLKKPELTRRGYVDIENPAPETKEEYAARKTKYENDLAAFETALEVERVKYDRIAFSGQVPCNLIGASVGDYIIPKEGTSDTITGEAVSSPTFEQYQKAVGKVWKVLDNGNAWISVKIG